MQVRAEGPRADRPSRGTAGGLLRNTARCTRHSAERVSLIICLCVNMLLSE